MKRFDAQNFTNSDHLLRSISLFTIEPINPIFACQKYLTDYLRTMTH